MDYDYIIVGAGFAGAVLAERIATQLDKKVLILERRSHVGGNCYDEVDESGVLIHTYGPHLFHTDNKKVYDYLSQFTSWRNYVHEVVAEVDGQMIPLPFNINTLYMVFEHEKATTLEEKLVATFGVEQKVPVLELLKAKDKDLQELGQYVYDKIFVNYTAKQWGKKPEEIDGAVTARVPVLTSRDNRYFSDQYQCLPENGYGELFNKMLSHDNITLKLSTDALALLKVEGQSVLVDGKLFNGKLIYTGMIDELLDNKFSPLPYRSLDLQFETLEQVFYQEHAVINYPNEYDFTRITEFKHLHPTSSPKTTILREYPQPYKRGTNTPYYPLFTDENKMNYQHYADYAATIDNLILVGRLAEYKYYDMDDIVARVLDVFEKEIRYER